MPVRSAFPCTTAPDDPLGASWSPRTTQAMTAQHIVAIVGSYRREGITDQAVDAVLAGAKAEGATVETIRLADHQIKFCTNCRECTQAQGARRGECPLDDQVAGIFDRMERADALLFASPVNYMDVTAVTRALLERMVSYFYWPWGQPAPVPRVKQMSKQAVLITSSAMPRVMGFVFTRSLRTLKAMAKAVGAKPLATLYVGLAAGHRQATLPAGVAAKARRLGERLVTGT